MTEEDYNPCVDVFLKMIKEAEPDMSRQMKSHYKKQFIIMSENENKENLVYKLCLQMWEMEDEIESYKGDVERKNDIIRELKLENRSLKGKSQKI